MIPIDIKQQIDKDQFYRSCCSCGVKNKKIDMHHNLIFAGKQVNKLWAILPLCVACHKQADNKDMKSKLNQIMRERSRGELEHYETHRKFV